MRRSVSCDRSKEMHFYLSQLSFFNVQHSGPHKWKYLMLYTLQTLIRIISEFLGHGME
jgi:hypothetical protein